MAKHMSYYQFQTDDSIKWKNTFSMAGLKVKNRLNANVSNVVVAFAQSPLSTNIDWKLVDVSNKINIDSLVEVFVGDLKANEEQTILGDIEYTDRKRGYWQVYFNIDDFKYAIKTNKAHANPWRQDHGKIVDITFGKYEKEFLVEFVFDSGSAHFVLGGLDAIRPNEKTSKEKEEFNLSKFNSTYF